MDGFGIAGSAVGGIAAVVNIVKNRKEIMNSMTGSLPRCMLFVPRVDSNVKANTTDAVKENKDVAALRNLVKKKTQSSTNSLLAAAGNAVAQDKAKQITEANKNIKNDYKSVVEALKQESYSVMEMQYNPSSLRLAGRGLQDITNMIGASDAAMNQSQRVQGSKMTRLSCELIFDQVNIQDSFLMEGMSPSLGNVVSMAGNIFTNVTKDENAHRWGDGYSVQIPVEGLVSLLQFKRTREVVFFWTDMFFHGNLTSVNATYTMFNKLGAPVRAKVQITIEQGDEQAKYKSDEDAWKASFDALWGEAGFSQYTSSGSNSIMKNIMG